MARLAFDLDGTLIDSAPDLHVLANRLLAGEGRQPITLAEARSFIGMGVESFVRDMRRARNLADAEHDRLVEAFMDGYVGAVELTTIMPHADETLAALKDAGHKIGISTNKPSGPARAVLAHLGLMQYVDALVGGDTAGERKPSPTPLLHTFDLLGSGPALYIGDSEIDAETAQRANAPFLLYAEGYAKADPAEITKIAVFSDFAVLPKRINVLIKELD
ncbi:MAG: HAD-IA family hydrolase [Paracoccaceae bacterium]|nr:HAD-IA family hydrolase [Paracoccaceae bacterium]